MAATALADGRAAARATPRRALAFAPLLAILVADLRQRTRSTRFRVVLLLTALAAWWCFPPQDAGYLVVAIGAHHRGFYSSAWIGMVLAMLTMLWSLAGFYIVRGTLQRDFDTRVWQLLGASSMSRAGYLAAKWASHLLVLAAILAGTLAVGLVAQWVRAEDRHLDLWELVKPSLFIALPILAVSATFVIWFDMIPRLRGTAGNVLFFFAWVTLLSHGAMELAKAPARSPAGIASARQPVTSDFAGLQMMQWAVDAQVRPQFPGQVLGDGFCIGCGGIDAPLERFRWTRWQVAPAVLWGRMLWVAAAVAGLLLAVPWLDRAAARSGAAGARAGAAVRPPRALRWLDAALAPLRRFPLGVLIAAETRVLLRMRAWWWWAAWLPLFAAQAFGSRHGMAMAMLGGWAWLLDAFSRTGLREQAHRTGELVWTAPGAGRRLLRARAAMLAGLAVVAVAPGLVHAARVDPRLLLSSLSIAASLSLGGLAAAMLTRGSRLFELLFLVAAYATTQGAPLLDVAAPGSGVAWAHAAVAAGAIALLGVLPAEEGVRWR
jgi:hypothetical protein